MSKPRKQSDVESKLIDKIDRGGRANTLSEVLDRVVIPPLRGEGKTHQKLGFVSHKAKFESLADSPVDNPVDNPVKPANPIGAARQEANTRDLQLSISVEEDIAARVRRYWLERGYHVHASVQQVVVKTPRSTNHYRAARSNLINALPVGYRDHTNQPLGVK